MQARVGKAAPNFEAPAFLNGDFTTIKLTDYLGKWVLICFYPGDFTFVCTTELADIAAHYKELQDLGVQVITVSVDTIYVHKIWNEHELAKMVDGGARWPMVTDTANHIGRAYGVYDEETGVEMRGRFIIDPDGVLQTIEVLTPPVGRNINETIRQIQAFQYVHKTEGREALPANWKPGDPTLKPGPDLVGNVWKVWKP